MKLYIEVPSRVPSIIYWSIMAYVMYFFYPAFNKDNLKEIPNMATTIIVLLLVLLALDLIFEKLLPKREVLYSEVVGRDIVLSKTSRKIFQKKISLDSIQEIRVAKNITQDLYIFLNNGKVKIISEKKETLNKLKIFIEKAMEEIKA